MALPVDGYPVLGRFQWQELREEDGFAIDALGGRTRTAFYSGLAASLPVKSQQTSSVFLETEPDEEFFEWIDLLEAVLEARNRFVMVELGCGWARWLVRAHLALKQVNDLPATLIGVEPEPTHFEWSWQHVRDNGLPESAVRLHKVAVGAEEGSASFYTGWPDAWYGQSLVPATYLSLKQRLRRLSRRLLRRPARPMDAMTKVKVRTLASLIEDLDRVDLLDLDIQGAEADVLAAAAETLDEKVRRVHIGTHSRDNEARLRSLFGRLGWTKVNDFGCDRWNETPAGRIWFQDGVQTWMNPKLAPGDD